ncbi:glucose-6-phosphatase 2-like isoform X2 [Macrobrachium rosenbergii]
MEKAFAFVESYHKWGAESIEFLQNVLPGRGPFFISVSNLGDPGLAFTFYFPIVIALHAGLGTRFMWSIVFCEWSNMLLKWLMVGDRPYWWVNETKLYSKGRPPVLLQFPNTCETGPGMPSGHAKLNAAMFYILVSALNTMVISKTSLLTDQQKKLAKRLTWLAYGGWMALVIVARVYVAAHFPHQCIYGALIGFLIAVLVSRTPSLHVLSRRQYVMISAAIIVTVLGMYFIVLAMGSNVLWSVEKAIKWCVQRSYIHIDSTPFYSFSRYSGVSLGLGLGLSSKWFRKTDQSRFNYKMIASMVILNLAASATGVYIHKLLSPSMFGWYVVEFTLNVVVTFLIVAVIPNFVRVACNMPPGDKYKKK